MTSIFVWRFQKKKILNKAKKVLLTQIKWLRAVHLGQCQVVRHLSVSYLFKGTISPLFLM